jgi:hypothetical protein
MALLERVHDHRESEGGGTEGSEHEASLTVPSERPETSYLGSV